MKNWQTASILALSAAIGASGWLFSSSTKAKEETTAEAVVSVRPVQTGGDRTETPVRVRPTANKPRGAGFAFDDGDLDDKDMNMSFGADFGFESEIKEKLNGVLQEIYDEYLTASRREDRKAMLAAIQGLLAKQQAGQTLPHWLKEEMIEGIKWSGGSAMPELMAMAADADADIAETALDALQDLLWDFDTTPQQVADALLQVVKLTQDVDIIEPFVMEMSNMNSQLKAQTALAVLDSGNAAAAQCVTDNLEFIFDDFNGSVKTREDIVAQASAETVSDSE